MQFLAGLFDGTGNPVMNALLALAFVLVLIVLGLWVLKYVFQTTSNLSRGRGRRLGVVEQLQIDGRRQVLIIRRDNVEHLILTGNAHDLVIETGIPVEDRAVTSPLRPAHPVPAPAPAAKVAEPPKPAEPVAEPPAPAPETKVATPAPVAAPHADPDPVRRATVLGSHAEPLREALRVAVQRKGPSLRHTALLRPKSREAAPYGSPAIAGDTPGLATADSARTPEGGANGRDKLESGAATASETGSGAA